MNASLTSFLLLKEFFAESSSLYCTVGKIVSLFIWSVEIHQHFYKIWQIVSLFRWLVEIHQHFYQIWQIVSLFRWLVEIHQHFYQIWQIVSLFRWLVEIHQHFYQIPNMANFLFVKWCFCRSYILYCNVHIYLLLCLFYYKKSWNYCS